MDFRPSVQITGDLSGGKRKNGMMAGRLGDGDGDAARHVSTVTAWEKKKHKKRKERGEKNVFCANKNR